MQRTQVLIAAAVLGACGGPPPYPHADPPVVLIVLDALSAQYVGHLGHDRDTTPELDRLAAEGVSCTQAFAPAPYTLASIPSLLTGRLPDRHGLVSKRDRLQGDEVTLAELLADRGYATRAAVGNFNGSSTYGITQGFEQVVEVFLPSERFPVDGEFDGHPRHLPRAAEYVELVDEWLEDPELRRRPAFLYLHLLEPHTPYEPPPEFRSRFVDPDYDGPLAGGETAPLIESNHGKRELSDADRRAARDLYDATLAYADHHLGRLFARLRAAGLYDRAWIVVTSDHGEAFWQHGVWGHNTELFEEMLQVPLVVKPPRGSGPQGVLFDGFVSTIDLLPSLMHWLGLEDPAAVSRDGLDLGAVLRSHQAAPHVGLRRAGPGTLEKWILRREGSRFRRQESMAVVSSERYDLLADPQELQDLGPLSAAEQQLLAPWLELSARPPGQAVELTEAQEAMLRALGYTDE
jgi:arylsulfatase A-like enzyme